MLDTAAYIGKSDADGIKLQLLHVLENTKLAQMYKDGLFDTLTEEQYISTAASVISVLPQNVVIHRLTGDGDKKILIAPKWSGDKRHVLNALNHELKIRNIYQGCAL